MARPKHSLVRRGLEPDELKSKAIVLEFQEGLHEEAVFVVDQNISSVRFPGLHLAVKQILASGTLAKSQGDR